MTLITRRFTLFLSAFYVLASATVAVAQTQPPTTIMSDTVWSGVIELQSNTTIAETSVRVLPGSIIRFAGKNKANGVVLHLRGNSSNPSKLPRLILDGTADQPIIVETPEGIEPGIIEIAPDSSATIRAKHVVFRRLGQPTTEKEKSSKPAIFTRLMNNASDLLLSECRFEQCGAARAEFVGPDSSAEIRRCTFTQTTGSAAVLFVGPGTGVKVLADNMADAAFETACPQVLIRNNVLIGDSAALMIRNRSATGITVANNYVHCTKKQDTGRYAARCEPASTQLLDNVLVGGTYVLETAPRTVRGNVLIGANRLQTNLSLQSNINEAMANSNNLGIETMTHALISESGPNTEIVGNLFLGATFTAIQIAQGQTGLRIEQNVFDGWNVGRHALDFDFTTTNETRVTFKNNIVAGYRLPPIHRQSSARSGSNEQKTSFTGLSAGDNTFVALTGPAYEGFGEHSSFGTGDRHVESLSAIGLTRAMPNSPATQAAADVDELLLTHRRSIAEVRQAWFEIYKSGPSK